VLLCGAMLWLQQFRRRGEEKRGEERDISYYNLKFPFFLTCLDATCG
jgi:hypothetical protein